MSEPTDVTVTIVYRLRARAPETVTIAPERYFDLLPGEVPALRGVPRHDHAMDYLFVDRAELETTELTIASRSSGAERVIRETFWNGGDSRVIERQDKGESTHWEMILETRIGDAPEVHEVLRLHREAGALVPSYHGLFRREPDGSMRETRLK